MGWRVGKAMGESMKLPKRSQAWLSNQELCQDWSRGFKLECAPEWPGGLLKTQKAGLPPTIFRLHISKVALESLHF